MKYLISFIIGALFLAFIFFLDVITLYLQPFITLGTILVGVIIIIVLIVNHYRNS
ncbi:MAG: hypothetical protein WC044_06085 [Crocinitomicaceae bacterium]